MFYPQKCIGGNLPDSDVGSIRFQISHMEIQESQTSSKGLLGTLGSDDRRAMVKFNHPPIPKLNFKYMIKNQDHCVLDSG